MPKTPRLSQAAPASNHLLLALSFTQTFAQGHWWLALPFALKALGGSDTHVGLALALNMGAYAVALTLAGRTIYRFRSHTLVRIATLAGCLLTAFLAALLIAGHYGHALPCPIPLVLATTTALGILLAAFWPPLVEWISSQSAGHQLNQHLGRFSLSWSLGTLLSPYVAGWLTQLNPIYPIAVAVAYLALGALFAFLAKPTIPAERPLSSSRSDSSPALLLPCSSDSLTPGPRPLTPQARATLYRHLSRIALFAVFVPVGLSRTQLPLLFKFELGLTESNYGLALTCTFLASTLIYILLGRTSRWHYRPGLFIAAQLAVALFLLLTLTASHLPLLMIATTALGLGGAFTYASHLYYGVSSHPSRTSAMATHEFILAAGFALGAVGGGQLSDHLGHYAPYYLGLAALTVAAPAQLLLAHLRRRSG